jgi:DNA-binding response OmpR family regulator
MNENSNTKINAALEELSQRELGRVKVFMIEDDQMIRELVVTKLMMSGCIPYSTDNGSEAITLAEHYSPDAIILDLMLPGMTGEEILAALKEKEALKKIPVIVFSNKSSDEDRQKVMSLGADRYFVKVDTDLNDLVEEIKSLTAAS